MNKKQLSSLLDQLAAKLEQASSDNKNLNLENKSLQEKCEKLIDETKVLEAEVAKLTAEVESLRAQQTETPVDLPDTESEATPKIEAEAENSFVLPPIINLSKKVTSKVHLSEETEYAASVIGKIVVSATESCNFLTTSGNPNAKELVNLILGKTEVLKAEILNIVYSPADFITKKALIDNQFDKARDYFASVKAQL